jgi:hypothetical protein
MPISGPALHRHLMDAYASAQSQLELERGQIQMAHTHRQSLDGDRGDVLVTLAQHYLPELSRDAIQSTWAEVRDEITAVLQRKEEHEGRISNDIRQSDAKRVAAEQELLDLNTKLDAVTEQKQSVATEVESRLKNDLRFVELSDRAAIAEIALERAEANLSEIEQDSARKLPSFDESSLFRYLHDRGFGTDKYASRGFTRRMDRMLAQFIKYDEASKSYKFLKQTPLQMRQIIAEDRAALDTVLDELERQRDAVASQLGLQDIIAQTDSLTRDREAKVKQLESIRIEQQSLQSQLTDLGDKRGPYYNEAIQVFRSMLERIDSRDLSARASMTRELTDDQIVARLSGIEASIDQLDEAARQRRQRLDTMQEYLEQLGLLIQKFRMSKFDSAQCQFVGSLDLVDELANMRNPYEMNDVWMKIQRAQQWGPSTMDRIATVARHPMTQILVNAMAQAAANALANHARNAGRRRGY